MQTLGSTMDCLELTRNRREFSPIRRRRDICTKYLLGAKPEEAHQRSPGILPNIQVPAGMLCSRWQLSSLFPAHITQLVPQIQAAPNCSDYISCLLPRTPRHPLPFKKWFPSPWTHQNESSGCTGAFTLKTAPLWLRDWNAVSSLVAVATANANPATLKNFTTDSSSTRGLCVNKTSFFFFLPEDKLGLWKLCPKAKIQLAGQS